MNEYQTIALNILAIMIIGGVGCIANVVMVNLIERFVLIVDIKYSVDTFKLHKIEEGLKSLITITVLVVYCVVLVKSIILING